MTDNSAQGESPERPPGRGRRLLGLGLLLLAAAWGLWLARPFLGAPGAAPQPTVTAADAAQPTATQPQAAAALPTPIGRATPWSVVGMGTPQTAATTEPTPRPIPTPRPLFPLGPPSDSRFRLGDTVTFYWTWPEPLTEGRQFALYVESDAGRVLVGVVEEANLGSAFQLTASLAAVARPGEYVWVVTLEDTIDDLTLAESSPRSIYLSDG